MTRAFLVRHGTTDWNESGRLQGNTEVGLNDRGRTEARAVARSLADERVTRVVTSPLSRAHETVTTIAERVDAPLSVDADWRERSFGSLEGRPASEALATNPEFHPKSEAFDPDAAGDGESARAVVERVRARWPPADGTVIVTHETPLRIAVALAEGTEPISALGALSFAPGDILEITGSAWSMRR